VDEFIAAQHAREGWCAAGDAHLEVSVKPCVGPAALLPPQKSAPEEDAKGNRNDNRRGDHGECFKGPS
jgi:hypothetical protein